MSSGVRGWRMRNARLQLECNRPRLHRLCGDARHWVEPAVFAVMPLIAAQSYRLWWIHGRQLQTYRLYNFTSVPLRPTLPQFVIRSSPWLGHPDVFHSMQQRLTIVSRYPWEAVCGVTLSLSNVTSANSRGGSIGGWLWQHLEVLWT